MIIEDLYVHYCNLYSAFRFKKQKEGVDYCKRFAIEAALTYGALREVIYLEQGDNKYFSRSYDEGNQQGSLKLLSPYKNQRFFSRDCCSTG